MFSSDKKLEYLYFADVRVLVHLTEVRYFGLAHKNLSRITESIIPRFHFVKGVGVSIFKVAQLRSQFATSAMTDGCYGSGKSKKISDS